jgi:hypothetical protein
LEKKYKKNIERNKYCIKINIIFYRFWVYPYRIIDILNKVMEEKPKTRDNIAKHLIEYQLNLINKTLIDTLLMMIVAF